MQVDLSPSEFNTYYQHYIAKVQNPRILEALEESKAEMLKSLRTLPEDKMKYAYAPQKWTVAEVIQHMIDTERIFGYRALRFSRCDQTPLPGFEQDDYIPVCDANTRTKEELIRDFAACKDNTYALFHSFTEQMLRNKGTASGSPMSARAAGFIIVGHQKHHLEVLEERYGIPTVL